MKGSEKRKRKEVAFARSLALDPEIIMYDRFLEGLDFRQKEFMISLVEDAHSSKTGRLSIFTANNLEEIKGMAFDRMLMIKDKALVRHDG